MDKPVKTHHNTAEKLKKTGKESGGFWQTKALTKLLENSDFKNFIKVIEKTQTACINSANKMSDHLIKSSEVIKAAEQADVGIEKNTKKPVVRKKSANSLKIKITIKLDSKNG
ncbi:MAG: hypothetical protein HFP78_06370 [Methylococcales symbiont of Hymedesmia sp. n. MRB-2018]|nr:MAG: hypothetical protein HFP78_06370 [Methylococcales symbiont of Hymedesmia sp. n. MRB-2018]